MSTTRRQILAALGAASIFPTEAISQNAHFPPNHVLENLEKSIWLSTNKNATRANYVIAAPWCPFCEKLYYEAANISDIDFRFIFLSFRGPFGNALVNAYFSSDADQVGLFYSDKTARNDALSPTAKDWMEQINTVTIHPMNRALGAIISGSGGSASGVGFAFPTVVQDNTNGNINGYLGAWNNLDALNEINVTKASNAPDVSRYANLLRSTPPLQRGRTEFYAREKNMPYYSAPILNAPIIRYQTKKHTGGGVDVMLENDNGRWFGRIQFPNGPGILGRAMYWGNAKDYIEQ